MRLRGISRVPVQACLGGGEVAGRLKDKAVHVILEKQGDVREDRQQLLAELLEAELVLVKWVWPSPAAGIRVVVPVGR